MKQILLLAYLTACVVIGHNLAPSWQNDVALWSRTVEVAPHHARAMVNLADAYAKGTIGTMTTLGMRRGSIGTFRIPPDEEHLRLALFWAAMARQHAHEDGLLPERERRTVIMAANSDMVSILLTQQPANAPLITELLEEIWQLQSGASPAK